MNWTSQTSRLSVAQKHHKSAKPQKPAPLYKQAAGINIFKAEHRNSLKYTDLATMEVFPIKEALTFVQYYLYISQLIKPEVSGPKIPCLKYYE